MTINLPQQSSRGVNRTAIEWADYAVGSPFRFRDKATGELVANACVKLSSGCANCYAETIGQRFKTGRPYTKAEMDRLECVIDESVIRSVLTFRPKPEKGVTTYKNNRPRPLLFLGDMTDIFGEWVPDHLIDPVIAAVALRPDVDVIVLTKRAGRMAQYFAHNGYAPARGGPMRDRMEIAASKLRPGWSDADDYIHGPWPLPNLWLYVSVEDQATADERIPHLLATLAAVRVVSAEPLIGHIELETPGPYVQHAGRQWLSNLCGAGGKLVQRGVDLLIIGGESGPDARPCNVEWIRSLVRQGKEAGVATFVKQLGGNVIIDASLGLRVHLHDRKGGDPSEWPADLRVRQMPGAEGGGE